MEKLFEQRRAFNKAMGLPSHNIPTLLSDGRWRLQRDMILEELQEYDEACRDGDIVEIADALGDILYLVIGAAKEHGLECCLEEVLEEIHKSNMSKVGPDGKVLKNAKGKVMKPETYFKPNVKRIIDNHYSKYSNQTELELDTEE